MGTAAREAEAGTTALITSRSRLSTPHRPTVVRLTVTNTTITCDHNCSGVGQAILVHSVFNEVK
jgi:hypothetical protein